MTSWGLVLCLSLAWSQLRDVNCSLQSGRRPRAKPNTVLGVNATCSSDSLDVRVWMERPFTGVLYSRGFPLECRGQGSGDTEVHLHLPATGCGVRVLHDKDGNSSYAATVEIQLGKNLQQIADQERTVVCPLSTESVVVYSPALAVASRPSFQPLRNNVRTGRKQSERITSDLAKPTESVKGWMEIRGSLEGSQIGQVTVGERTRLLIKARLPDGLGFRVTDCVAHDGVGDSSQRLLDEVGCPLDELILPSLITTTETTDNEGSDVTGRASSSSHSRVQVAEAVFSAFKFPDRDSLHLRCTLQLCRGDCSEVECGREIANSSNVRRTARLKQGEKGEVLERLEVFNSVEVLAPGIELDEMRDMGTTRETDFSAPVFSSTGERAFCMSAPKMALAFGVLGLIFLCAVAVALCTLMRGRTNHYRRKLAMFGSEDTLVVQDSPFLGHRLQWPYVRVMR